MELEGTRDRGAQECGFCPRVPRLSSSSAKLVEWSRTNEGVLESGLELVKLLDEWEVMGLGTRFWKVTPNAVHVAKCYAPRNCYIIMEESDLWGWVTVIPVTNI